MSVTVDRQPYNAGGMSTVGQVLCRLQKEQRLVVHLLIDGEEPDPSRLSAARQTPLTGHTLYIETADPRELALEVLDEVHQQLAEADRLKTDAADLLQRNAATKAMEKLSGCFTIWQHAQESLTKTAELLRIDPRTINVEGQPLMEMLNEFNAQLREIRSALEQRDFVSLTDILLYETTRTSQRWTAAIESLRKLIKSLV